LKNLANILVYVSSADAVPLAEGGSHPTGVFLGELTEPLEPLVEAGHNLAFISPDGKPPTIDENSYKLIYWGWSGKRLKRAKEFYQLLIERGLGAPKPINALLENRQLLENHDVLFVPGGHAPMTDILYEDWLLGEIFNSRTADLLLHFHQRQKPTALICHAPSALAAVKDADGKWPYQGYKITCVSRLSEWLTEDAPILKVMRGHLPKYPERILKQKGARLYLIKLPMISNVVEDRELITGQDPYSARELGRRLLEKTEKYLAG